MLTVRQVVGVLTDRVRVDLGRLVCEPHRNSAGLLRVIALEPALDSELRRHLHEGTLAIGPGALSRMIEMVLATMTESKRTHQPLALLVDQKLRRPLKSVLTRPAPDLAIIAYQELPGDLSIETAAILPCDHIMGDDLKNDAGGAPAAGATPDAPAVTKAA